MKEFVNYQKLSCPPERQNDPRYKEVGNQCFYFENTTLSHAQAQENCKDKFTDIGAVGKLFEPKTLAKNKAVSEAGQEILGSVGGVHIGVDDIGNNETFKYSSGGNFLSIENPPWWSSHYPRNTGTYCVRSYFYANSNNGKWVDVACGNRYYSVCEATFQLHLSDHPFMVDLKVLFWYYSLAEYSPSKTFLHDLIFRMKLILNCKPRWMI